MSSSTKESKVGEALSPMNASTEYLGGSREVMTSPIQCLQLVGLRQWRIRLLGLGLYLFCAVSSFAQPPALGPTTFRSDKTQIGVGVITAIVKTELVKAVAQANDEIHKQTSHVTVEALPLRVFGPRRVATQFTNRPNENYVNLRMFIEVKVKIRFTTDRTITIPLNVKFSCAGWHTGSGTIQIVAETERSIIEGGNIIEDVIRVRDLVNNFIRSRLTLPNSFPVPTLLNPSCVTIGASPGQFVGDPFAFIAYDQPLRLPTNNLFRPSTITVKLQKLRRLRARDKDRILYQPIENILLETYANFATRQSAVLTMREDDEVNLGPLVLNTSRFGQLVIIANIRHQPTGQPEDSAFAAFPATANFSPGTHKLQITKVFTEPPGPTHNKPVQIRVPAYELTYTVAVEPGSRGFTRAP